MRKRILLIGPLPDPKGGVSIHIKRLGDLISPYCELSFIDESSVRKRGYFNFRSLNLFKYIKLIIWADIVHVHSAINILRIVHICISKLLFKKVIITFHYTPINQNLFLLKILLNRCNKVVFVNKETAKMLPLRTTSYIKEAFIPPNIVKEPPLPGDIENWIKEKKAEDYFVLSANAFRFDLINNIDLYGLDMCISLINELKKTLNRKVALVFAVSSINESDSYFIKSSNLIKELGVENEILITKQNISFVKVIEYSDIVLRPTIIDGDALTIRESLYLGVPVIASNVVARPKCTILFENRNQEDLFAKVNSTLENLNMVKECLSYPENEDYIAFYKNLYEL